MLPGIRPRSLLLFIIAVLSLLTPQSSRAQSNLWDPTAVADGYLNGTNGAFNPASEIALSGFIHITPGATFTSNHGLIINIAGLCFYDAAQVRQSCYSVSFENLRNAPATFTVPTSPAPAWMRLSLASIDSATEQLIAVTAFPTPSASAPPSPVVAPVSTAPVSTVPVSAAPVAAQTNAPLSNLSGKNVMFVGDSLSSQFGNKWQQAFIKRTGAIYYGQDVRPGRTWASVLEGYGAWCPLLTVSALGPYDPATATDHSPQCGYPTGGTLGLYGSWPTPQAGYTLAQTLADVDLLVIALGINDVSAFNGQPGSAGALGTITDSYTAGTEFAAMNFALDAIYSARPGISVILVTPYYFGGPGDRIAAIQPIVDAQIAEGQRRGIPVLNMLANGNINAINLNMQTRDTYHGTDLYLTNVYGPKVAEFAARQF